MHTGLALDRHTLIALTDIMCARVCVCVFNAHHRFLSFFLSRLSQALSRHGPPLFRQRGRQSQPAQKEAQTALLFVLFLFQFIGKQSNQPQQTLKQTKPLTLQRERKRKGPEVEIRCTYISALRPSFIYIHHCI